MAEGSNRYLAYAVELVEGTAPTGEYTKIRNTGGSGITNERTTIESDEIRDDRAIIVSRLGNNAPMASIPIELSFQHYEDLMEAALGSTFVGDYELVDIDVDFVTTGGYMDTADASSWVAKGVAVGDYITVTDTDIAGNAGVYYVSAIGDSAGTNDRLTLLEADATTGATLSDDTDDTVTIVGGYYGSQVDSSTNNITVNATNRTYTAASALWVTAGVKVGDYVYFAGFTNSNNNGWHRVDSVTATVLTFVSGETFTNETLTTGDLDFATSSALLTCGLDLQTLTIEEGFNDVLEYHNMLGSKVSTFGVSVTTDDKITGSFDLTGQEYSGFSATALTKSGFATANTNDVFDSYTGDLIITGVGNCVVTGMDFTLDNGLNPRYALMNQNPCSIGEGRINVTGSINAYFPDSTLADIYNNETQISIQLRVEDLDENSYLFGFPAVQFTSDSRTITENDVTEAIDFRALGTDTTYTTMYVVKQAVRA